MHGGIFVFLIPETNVVKKDWRKVELKIALCYPNVYRAGMTGLTIQLLYSLFNSREDVVCERFFLPTKEDPLLSLESNQPLKQFDIIAFTLQYEEDYFNTIKILLDANIKINKADRNFKPLIVAGGPCSTQNPFPLRDFIDLFLIGELEPVFDEFIDELKNSVREKTVENFENKPGFFTQNKGRRIFIKNLNDAPHPIAQILPNVKHSSPYMPVWGKTFTVEAIRGCPRACKFCLATQIVSPKRERSLNKLKEIISDGVKFTGASKVSVVGAGIAFYSKLEELCEYIVDDLELQVSLPSLDVEELTENLIKLLVKGNERTISLAPETGSESLRKSLGKKASNKKIIDTAKTALYHGIKNLKLYYIIGLPNETLEDLHMTAELSRKIAALGFRKRSIRLSLNPLIPKPHTQYHSYRFRTADYLKKAIVEIRKNLNDRRIEIETLNLKHARIQAVLSSGGPELGELIYKTTYYCGGIAGWRKALSEKRETEDALIAKSYRENFWANIRII